MIRLLAGAIGLTCWRSQRACGRSRRDRHRLSRPRRHQADAVAGRAAGRERRRGRRPARDRGQQHHRQVPQPALHPGGCPAQGRRRRRPAALALADRGIGFIIADLPADALLKAADAVRERGTVLLNAGAIDDRLREEDCRANVIHAAPTRSMLADGLAQYLVWKQWRRWLLVVGSHAEDKLYADALRRAATRFGAKIVQERCSRTPAARAAPTAAYARSSGRCRCSRNGARPTMSWSRPTRARCSRPTCPIGPGTRGRSPARPACADELGRRPRSVGRRADAEPLHRSCSRRMTALDMQAWTAGAHDRRSGVAHQFRRPARRCSISSRVRISRSPRSRASG